MRDDLLLYYEQELTYLRQMAGKFAAKYPKIAARLVLEPDKCEDPHVERLLEAFAFMAARVHLKIDDEFPEITEALLGVVYPHFIRPIPSMSIVEFQMDPEQGKLTTGFSIERGTVLYSRPVGGVPCKFRTAYDTTLWPITVVAAEWTSPSRLGIRAPESVAAIRLELKCAPDLKLSQLELNQLRFHLNGEGRLVHKLHELLLTRLDRIIVRDPAPGSRAAFATLGSSSLRQVGFGEDEGLLPYPRRSFLGYRLLQEYFAFPEKFFFIDLNNLKAVWTNGFGGRAELIFLLSSFEGLDVAEMLEVGITPKTFRLGCTPIVNLFDQSAEPILLDQQKYEYPVIPDVRRMNATEIFSIDGVTGINLQTREETRYEPFYAFRHSGESQAKQAFWTASRRQSVRADDAGTDMFISLLDLSQRPVRPEADTLIVRTTCTNGDLPARLPFGNETGDFQLEGANPVKRIVALRKPTSLTRPPTGRTAQWRLISHLSLNYLSLVEDGREALQQILKLYNFAESPYARKSIEGISQVKSKRQFAPVLSEDGIAFVQGTRVEIEFDEEQFVGGGVYLFASVLERFFGLYASLNSYTQLVVTTKQRKETLAEWAPRAGQRILV